MALCRNTEKMENSKNYLFIMKIYGIDSIYYPGYGGQAVGTS